MKSRFFLESCIERENRGSQQYALCEIAKLATCSEVKHTIDVLCQKLPRNFYTTEEWFMFNFLHSGGALDQFSGSYKERLTQLLEKVSLI